MGIWPFAPWGQHAAPQTPAEGAKRCEVLRRLLTNHVHCRLLEHICLQLYVLLAYMQRWLCSGYVWSVNAAYCKLSADNTYDGLAALHMQLDIHSKLYLANSGSSTQYAISIT